MSGEGSPPDGAHIKRAVTVPPPLPPEASLRSPMPAPAGPSTQQPAPRSSARVWIFAGLVGLAGAALGYYLRPTPIPIYQASGARSAAPQPSAPPPMVELGPNVASDTSLSSCVSSYFPMGTFGSPLPFAYVCQEQNVWKIAEELDRDVRKFGSGNGADSWNGLGWYELAVAGFIRKQCCEDVAPLVLGTPSGKCPGFEETLQGLIAAPTPQSRSAYHSIAECMVEHGIPAPRRFRKVKLSEAKMQLDQFLR